MKSYFYAILIIRFHFDLQLQVGRHLENVLTFSMSSLIFSGADFILMIYSSNDDKDATTSTSSNITTTTITTT